MVRILALVALILGSRAYAEPFAEDLEPSQLRFVYQELLEPYDKTDCKFEKSRVGLFEWDVYCKLGSKVHEFGVHLVLTRYGKTVYGDSAYELLYWVTDRSEPRERTFDSTTLWFHMNDADSHANVIEVSQGVKNDLAALRLTIVN